MEDFIPVSGLLGGVMIGPAAALMLLLNGGISGTVGGPVAPGARKGGDVAWRVAFVVGLVLGPPGYAPVTGGPSPTIGASLPVLVVAGPLVGSAPGWGPAAPAATASAG